MNKHIQILSIAIVLILAVVVGSLLPTASVETIGVIWLVVAGMFCFSLRQNVWKLIPISLLLQGGFNFMPGGFNTTFFMVITAIAFLFLRFLGGARELKYRYKFIDLLVVGIAVFLIQAYIRNPVGMSVFGSGKIGGKPYLTYTIAILGYFALSMIRTNLQDFAKVVKLMLILAVGEGIYLALCGAVPTIGFYTERIYGTGISMQTYGTVQTLAESRLGYLKTLAEVCIVIMCSMWRPITGLVPFYIKPFLVTMFTVGITLLSGFRSRLVYLFFLFVAGTIARKKPRDLLVILAGVCILIPSLIVLSSSVTLPTSIQRSISFLPGVETRDDIAMGAEGSIEWRMEMWKLALGSDDFIKNKILGDGFGMTAMEFQLAQDEKLGYTAFNNYGGIEYYMAKGSYHGFHVETIRFIGALGLILVTIFLICLARYSWKMVHYYRGRDELGYVLVVTLPLAIAWLYYWLIFGSFKAPQGFPLIILMAGMVRLLDNIRIGEIEAARSNQLQD